jgi:hypothetical protein
MSCPHYNIDRQGYCIFCGVKVETTETPHVNWNDPIDPFEMAKAIKEKTENDKDKNAIIPPKDNTPTEIDKPTELERSTTQRPLIRCPFCHEISLFYNQYLGIYECIKVECRIKTIFQDEHNQQASKASDQTLNSKLDYNTIKQPIKHPNKTGCILSIILLILIILVSIKWNTLNETIDNINTVPTPTYTITPEPNIIYTTIPPVKVVAITPTLPTITITPRPVITTIAPTFKLNNNINAKTGTYKNYYLGLVNNGDSILGGNGYYDNDGEFIILINNKDATNPTYSQLIDFLRTDTTDKFPYISTTSTIVLYYNSAESHVNLKYIKDIIDEIQIPTNPKECGDFAERLHNNAEQNGIRCGYVSMDLKGYSWANIKTGLSGSIPNSNHALNIFETIDKGLIYIDCTGLEENEQHPYNMDKIVDVKEGKSYIPESLFPESGWKNTWENVGKIENVYITWDGEWNK